MDMSKSGKVDLGDLTLAPRRSTSRTDGGEHAQESEVTSVVADVTSQPQEQEAPISPVKAKRNGRGLLSKPPQERREQAIQDAIEREDAASRLRNLKKAKSRESRHFINIPLDWDTKKALEDAAHEHGLKMTVIVRDALSLYLREAGYLPQ